LSFLWQESFGWLKNNEVNSQEFTGIASLLSYSFISPLILVWL